ncbi:hypothetical protein HanPI659440_Chr13g0492951 [Helianthus annuus]|nr:hypothetical protein HanPI659440_Chr13g0492951 [Helianthus annuus]
MQPCTSSYLKSNLKLDTIVNSISGNHQHSQRLPKPREREQKQGWLGVRHGERFFERAVFQIGGIVKLRSECEID